MNSNSYAHSTQPERIIATPEPDIDRQHAIVGETRGYTLFICETNPLTTQRFYGIPEKCCFCGKEFPTVAAPSPESLNVLMEK